MAKTVLMVEGKDDVHVVKGFCGARELGRIDHLREFEGKDRLLEAIPVQLKESGITSLGILLDADADRDARWTAIRSRLVDAGYEGVPETPGDEGLILDPPNASLLPKVGVWLMPDNLLPGILEDFLKVLVPAHDELFAKLVNCLDSIPAHLIKFPSAAKPKALIHTWLALQEQPGRPLGQAITARYLDAKLPSGDLFANWLSSLFFR